MDRPHVRKIIVVPWLTVHSFYISLLWRGDLMFGFLVILEFWDKRLMNLESASGRLTIEPRIRDQTIIKTRNKMKIRYT